MRAHYTAMLCVGCILAQQRRRRAGGAGCVAARAAVNGRCRGTLRLWDAAGSGKTRVIAARVLHLCSSAGVSPADIVALTFTRRAAAELQQRARTALGEPGAARLRVCTFHTLCAALLRAHGAACLAAGDLPARFSVSDAAESARALREAHAAVVAGARGAAARVHEAPMPPEACLGAVSRLKAKVVVRCEACRAGGGRRVALGPL